MDPSLEALREQFFAKLDEPGAGPEHWLQVWRILVGNPWYQAELEQAAKRVAGAAGAVEDLFEDLREDALVLLAQHLRETPDVHVDRAMAEEHFSGWLAKIIMRDCQQALRSRRRSQKRAGLSCGYAEPIAISEYPSIDLTSAIADLPEPDQSVVEMVRRGWSLNEIAAELDITYRRADLAFHRGTSLLAELL